MPLILIIILSFLAGVVFALIAIYIGSICLEQDRETFERMAGRSVRQP